VSTVQTIEAKPLLFLLRRSAAALLARFARARRRVATPRTRVGGLLLSGSRESHPETPDRSRCNFFTNARAFARRNARDSSRGTKLGARDTSGRIFDEGDGLSLESRFAPVKGTRDREEMAEEEFSRDIFRSSASAGINLSQRPTSRALDALIALEQSLISRDLSLMEVLWGGGEISIFEFLLIASGATRQRESPHKFSALPSQ